MLMRTDPFRDLDRLTQQVFGTAARPAVMPMDAWREGEAFVVEFDLPGVKADSLDLDVERNTLTVHAERPARDETQEMVAAERPTDGDVQSAVVPRRQPRHREDRRSLRGRGAAADDPGCGESQAPQGGDHQFAPEEGDQRLS